MRCGESVGGDTAVCRRSSLLPCRAGTTGHQRTDGRAMPYEEDKTTGSRCCSSRLLGNNASRIMTRLCSQLQQADKERRWLAAQEALSAFVCWVCVTRIYSDARRSTLAHDTLTFMLFVRSPSHTHTHTQIGGPMHCLRLASVA